MEAYGAAMGLFSVPQGGAFFVSLADSFDHF